MKRLDLTDDVLAITTKFSGLHLSDDRLAAVAPVIEDIVRSLDLLNNVELGNTDPAIRFDPAWED